MSSFLALTLLFDPLRDYFALVDPPSGTLIMMGFVVGATALLLPVVWRLGNMVITWAEPRLGIK
jgi:hypothetical protein